ALLKLSPKQWPSPTDLAFVKRDTNTLKKLREAATCFAELIRQALGTTMREMLEGWRLACLANNPERQTEAQHYCAELIERNPIHPIAMHWAAARDYVT